MFTLFLTLKSIDIFCKAASACSLRLEATNSSKIEEKLFSAHFPPCHPITARHSLKIDS